MGKKLSDIQNSIFRKKREIILEDELIRINGHWISSKKYRSNKRYYHSLPLADGYLDELKEGRQDLFIKKRLIEGS